MLLRLVSVACLFATAAVGSPRPSEDAFQNEALEVDRKAASPPLLSKDGGVATESCSLDAALESMTMGDMERLIERFAKLQGRTVSGAVKQLYSALYSSIKRNVASEEGMSLEAIHELCLRGAGPAYQLVPPHGPVYSGLNSVYVPNTEFAPLPPIRNLRPPPGAKLVVVTGPAGEELRTSIIVSPKMSVVDALRQADYRLAADTGRASGEVVDMGYSATRACYIVESVADLRASPERAWKITISDRFGKLVYEGTCLPREGDVVIQPRMTITLSYIEAKRKAQ
ncbi:hypothetical protein V5799_014874 [Amblyomma americanum]|uniref:Secreted protein n=1 Tax=Amblyomma americanum TaxID=6943 RepID=A0AAQ4E1S1_AMBAM